VDEAGLCDTIFRAKAIKANNELTSIKKGDLKRKFSREVAILNVEENSVV
jgi:hypothetical protein